MDDDILRDECGGVSGGASGIFADTIATIGTTDDDGNVEEEDVGSGDDNGRNDAREVDDDRSSSLSES
jgi:hypothetical protein